MIRKKTLFSLLASCVIALSLAAAPMADAATTYVTFATGGAGGAFYAIGAGMANMMTKFGKDISASAEATGASVANVKLLGAKKVEFGLVATDAAYAAYNAQREFKDTPIKSLRLVLVGYSAPFHIITRDDGSVKSVADLKGKRIAAYPGNTSEFQLPAIMEVCGLKKDDYKTVPLQPAEQVESFKNGSVDCIFTTIGAPTASFIDLATSHKVRFLSLPDDIIQRAAKELPFFPADTIAGGVYPGQNYDVHTLSTRIVILTHDGVSDDLVTEYLTIMHDKKDELAKVHGAASGFKAENIKDGAIIPLHPAAEKFYRAKGLIK